MKWSVALVIASLCLACGAESETVDRPDAPVPVLVTSNCRADRAMVIVDAPPSVWVCDDGRTVDGVPYGPADDAVTVVWVPCVGPGLPRAQPVRCENAESAFVRWVRP